MSSFPKIENLIGLVVMEFLGYMQKTLLLGIWATEKLDTKARKQILPSLPCTRANKILLVLL